MSASSTGRWARWGWLATTFAMGVALIAASWSGNRRALQAASTLNRGQSDVLLEALRQKMRAVQDNGEAVAFAEFLEDQSAAGLRFIGMYSADSLLASAGTPVGAPPAGFSSAGRGGSPSLNTVGSRLRVVTFAPRSRGPGDWPFRGGDPRTGDPSTGERRGGDPRPGSPAAVPAGTDSQPGEPTAGGARGANPQQAATPASPGSDSTAIRVSEARAGASARGGGQRGMQFAGRQPVALVLEFDPVVAEQLATQSARTFGLAVLVTVVLLGAALLFWRLSIVHEQEQRNFEHQRRLGALGEMSAVLAHEIRNPLASLKGHAQLLAGRLASQSPEHRKAERVVNEAKRLEALVNDLLDFTRAGTIERRTIDPARLLRDAVREVGSDAFTVSTGSSPKDWSLDPERVRQALTNLLRNARQASPPDRRAEASVAAEGGRLVFAVRDHGEGIAAGEESRVFEPFYTTRTQGTGLGLAVAKRVADLHDGSIRAMNDPAGGAVFRIEIPRA